MSDIAIRVTGLSKEYRIGGRAEVYSTARDAIVKAIVSPYRRIRSVLRGGAAVENQESFWALRDVSFDINHGDVVGIIGRNGAGKSTLLKILSRITEPTAGTVLVHGRVGALLEVGTGFHPELTGRENIYLNGAILGMSQAEITRKFDEIVDFAGVEKFIDTAVKHYSSGMGLRLGFAVAAHLEPEILIVDEVLAVGDAQFQKKCLGKMGEVAESGRTVLFVSHNMSAVRSLCPKSMLLVNGSVDVIGETDQVLDRYMMGNRAEGYADDADFIDRLDREGGQRLRFNYVGIHDTEDAPMHTLSINQPFTLVAKYISPTNEALTNVTFGFRVEDMLGDILFAATTTFTGQDFDQISVEGVLRCDIPAMPLVAGEYRLAVWCQEKNTHVVFDHLPDSLQFTVMNFDFNGNPVTPNRRYHGLISVPQRWTFSSETANREVVG